MATLVLSAVGTIVAGPLGGALGALAGNQIDRAIFAPGGSREGPRIRDLAITTSSYGQPIPRIFGSMRVPGTIIWSTDLIERSETSGGGKGRPSTTSFSYSVSFAVALSSRPIQSIGRIWADGNLLRGNAGDLKVAGQLRIHHGHGDQLPDPLIAAAEGPSAPAFRGISYAVFEDLQLEEFGNRIPALTFEVIADPLPAVHLAQIAPDVAVADTENQLNHLAGFSDEGGQIFANLQAINQIYPLYCSSDDGELMIGQIGQAGQPIATLPPPLTLAGRDQSGNAIGASYHRAARNEPRPTALRYYDRARDYQPGMQRAIAQRASGQEITLELPAAIDAAGARQLANAKAMRDEWAVQTITWVMADLTPQLQPAAIVEVPGYAGEWVINSWEWSDSGVELSLSRLPPENHLSSPAEAGRISPPVDDIAPPTIIETFELPWDGTGSSADGAYFAAVSAVSPGWRGASLFLHQSDSLVPLNLHARQRSIIGHSRQVLAPSNCTLFEGNAAMEIDLIGNDLILGSTTMAGLANGANRLLVGDEVIQFLTARQIDEYCWRLEGLLRGRGGTEWAAMAAHPIGTRAILLDDRIIAIDPALIGEGGMQTIAAIGIGDEDPALAELTPNGISRRPPHPVHTQSVIMEDGSWQLRWARRARGQWRWPDHIETPLIEEAETYQIGIGAIEQPLESWVASETNHILSPAQIGLYAQQMPQAPIWVRQIGTFGPSAASLITHLP